MLLFPDARSWGLVPAIAGRGVCGLAFATPIGAFSAAQPAGSAGSFAVLTRFVITPLFLFGGVFYPVVAAAGLAAGGGVRDTAVPRRRAVPRVHLAHPRRRPMRSCTSACSLAYVVGRHRRAATRVFRRRLLS